jgi:hypothetical protein
MNVTTQQLPRTPAARAGNTVDAADASAKGSDVPDDIAGGGVAFADFVRSVGRAVAEGQADLDATLQKSTTELAGTKVSSVAVVEQWRDDETGLPTTSDIHVEQVPLLDLVKPPAYQWSTVRLEAEMEVERFTSADGFEIRPRSVGGGGGLPVDAAGTQARASVSQTREAGRLRLEATLAPRSELELPRPFVLQRGPRLTVELTALQPVMAEGQPGGPPVGRRALITATLVRHDDSPNAAKQLHVRVDAPGTATVMPPLTDLRGRTVITVTRAGPAFDEDQPRAVAVEVSFGLVVETIEIAL